MKTSIYSVVISGLLFLICGVTDDLPMWEILFGEIFLVGGVFCIRVTVSDIALDFKLSAALVAVAAVAVYGYQAGLWAALTLLGSCLLGICLSLAILLLSEWVQKKSRAQKFL